MGATGYINGSSRQQYAWGINSDFRYAVVSACTDDFSFLDGFTSGIHVGYEVMVLPLVLNNQDTPAVCHEYLAAFEKYR